MSSAILQSTTDEIEVELSLDSHRAESEEVASLLSQLTPFLWRKSVLFGFGWDLGSIKSPKYDVSSIIAVYTHVALEPLSTIRGREARETLCSKHIVMSSSARMSLSSRLK